MGVHSDDMGRSKSAWIAMLGSVLIGGALLLLRAQNPPRAEGSGVRVSIPQGWTWVAEVANDGGPIALKRFAGPYANGGILAPGSADIHVTSDNAPSSLAELARQEAMGATGVQTQETSVLNSPAMTMYSVDNYAPELNLATRAVYVLHGSKVYKFYLSYHAGEPRASTFDATFQQLVATAQFTE